MRLWSLHPSYLDAKGLVAVWREGLLALHVLSGKTKGYINHPQLLRFRDHPTPLEAITLYLHEIVDEAEKRGYHFDRKKLAEKISIELIPLTKGQLDYEMLHLKKKLQSRDLKKFSEIEIIKQIKAHPLFKIIEGAVAPWEKM